MTAPKLLTPKQIIVTTGGTYIVIESLPGATLTCGADSYTLGSGETFHAFEVDAGTYACAANKTDYYGASASVTITSGFEYVTLIPTFLPTAYQQVEYIESTGTQYINTAVEGWDNLIVNLDFRADWLGDEFDYFGSADVGQNGYNYAGGFYKLQTSFVLQIGTNYVQYGSTDALRHVHKFNAVNKTAQLDNGTATAASALAWYTTAQCAGKPFRLFTRIPGTNNNGNICLYSATFTRDGSVIRQFIPCYRISDMEPGLFDKANNVFYTNAGTGAFTVGADVN